MRLAVDEAIADRHWDDAERALRTLQARVGDSHRADHARIAHRERAARRRGAAPGARDARPRRRRGRLRRAGADRRQERLRAGRHARALGGDRAATKRSWNGRSPTIAARKRSPRRDVWRRSIRTGRSRPRWARAGKTPGAPPTEKADRRRRGARLQAAQLRTRARRWRKALVKDEPGDDARVARARDERLHARQRRRGAPRARPRRTRATCARSTSCATCIAWPPGARAVDGRPKPPLEESGMQARDLMTKMFSSAEPVRAPLLRAPAELQDADEAARDRVPRQRPLRGDGNLDRAGRDSRVPRGAVQEREATARHRRGERRARLLARRGMRARGLGRPARDGIRAFSWVSLP